MFAHRVAFTLIELLVVIAVIAVLAGLLVTGSAFLRRRAALVDVNQRIDAVSQGLSRLGAGDGGVTMALQRAIPAFGGTKRFTVSPATPTHECFPSAGTAANTPLVSAYPWGRARTYWIIESWYNDAKTVTHPVDGWGQIAWAATPTGALNGATRMFTADQREVWAKPEPRGLSELRPHLSLELLVAAGVLENANPATVMASPPKRKPWNDPWGNPLIVAYALFQPPKCDNNEGGKKPDYYLARAEETYGYSRSTFVAVGSVGPRPRETLPANFSAPELTAYLKSGWKQINEVCNDTDQVEPFVDRWRTSATENAFANPPWKGVVMKERINGPRGDFCLLSAPVEFK